MSREEGEKKMGGRRERKKKVREEGDKKKRGGEGDVLSFWRPPSVSAAEACAFPSSHDCSFFRTQEDFHAGTACSIQNNCFPKSVAYHTMVNITFTCVTGDSGAGPAGHSLSSHTHNSFGADEVP